MNGCTLDREYVAGIPPYERQPLGTHQRTGCGNAELHIGGELADVASGKTGSHAAAAHIGDEIDLNVCVSLPGTEIERPIAPLAHAGGQTNQSRYRCAEPSSPRPLVPFVHQGERCPNLGIAAERHRSVVGSERERAREHLAQAIGAQRRRRELGRSVEARNTQTGAECRLERGYARQHRGSRGAAAHRHDWGCGGRIGEQPKKIRPQRSGLRKGSLGERSGIRIRIVVAGCELAVQRRDRSIEVIEERLLPSLARIEPGVSAAGVQAGRRLDPGAHQRNPAKDGNAVGETDAQSQEAGSDICQRIRCQCT